MKCAFLLVLAFWFSGMAVANRVILFEPGQNNIKLISVAGKMFLIAKNQLARVEKSRVASPMPFAFECRDAAVLKEKIILATNQGIKIFDPRENAVTDLLPSVIPQKNIDYVAVDKNQQLWYGSRLEGCFMVTDSNQVVVKVRAPAINCIASTPDGNMWVGTNIGLYKFPPNGKEIFRYTEEGIEGYELPDAMVERVYTDTNSNVWVVMPDNISFIAGSNPEGEIPKYDFVGNKGNILFDIAKVPVAGRSYFFATAAGILYASNIRGDADHHKGEIHHTFNERAVAISDTIIERPLALKEGPVLRIFFSGSETWFITEKGMWTVSTKKLLRRLKGV